MLSIDKYEALKQYFGHSEFRFGQEDLVDALLAGRDVLGVMPTGAGKSVCYQLPALLLPGITLVLSPLISLMKDQVASLTQAGIPAAFINSTLSPEQYREVFRRARRGAYKLIYAAPERLETPEFLRFAQEVEISLLAVDEAHCVSQWGQDFRPSYLKIADFLQQLPYRPPVGAFTATATRQVKEDIRQLLLLRDPLRLTTGFDRPNLFFEVVHTRNKEGWLEHFLDSRPGQSGIVYCATRKAVEAVCAALTARGVPAARYHAGLPEEERRRSQEDFEFDRVRVMVATNAFGMGICTYFELDYNGRNCDNYALFTSWGRKLYVFPRYGDKFIIIDLEKEKVQKNKILSSKIQANRKNKEKDTMSYFWCGCQLENKAWLFSKQGNMAVVYDMNSSMWQEYEIPGNIDNCVSVMPYEDKFYLLNSKGIVYCWDAKCALVEIIADCSNSSGDNTRFSQIGVSGKRIFILPALEKDIYYVDLKTRQINKYETYPKGFRYCGPENWSKFYGYCEDEECYYFAMRSANFMLVLNKQSGKEKWIKPRQLLREEYIKVYFNYNRSLLQETECNLEDVLDYLDYDSANIQKKKGISLGKQVWRQVK